MQIDEALLITASQRRAMRRSCCCSRAPRRRPGARRAHRQGSPVPRRTRSRASRCCPGCVVGLCRHDGRSVSASTGGRAVSRLRGRWICGPPRSTRRLIRAVCGQRTTTCCPRRPLVRAAHTGTTQRTDQTVQPPPSDAPCEGAFTRQNDAHRASDRATHPAPPAIRSTAGSSRPQPHGEPPDATHPPHRDRSRPRPACDRWCCHGSRRPDRADAGQQGREGAHRRWREGHPRADDAAGERRHPVPRDGRLEQGHHPHGWPEAEQRASARSPSPTSASC